MIPLEDGKMGSPFDLYITCDSEWGLTHSFQNLPMPPSLNRCYRNVRGIGRVATGELTDFKAEMMLWGHRNKKDIEAVSKKLQSSIFRLDLNFFMKRTNLVTQKNSVKRNDVSNRIKAIEDGLCKLLLTDDKYVFSLTARKILSESDEYVNADVYLPRGELDRMMKSHHLFQ